MIIPRNTVDLTIKYLQNDLKCSKTIQKILVVHYKIFYNIVQNRQINKTFNEFVFQNKLT